MSKTHLVIPDACAVCNEKPKKPSSASFGLIKDDPVVLKKMMEYLNV